MKTTDDIHLEDFKERRAHHMKRFNKTSLPQEQRLELAGHQAIIDMVDEIHVMLRKLLSK